MRKKWRDNDLVDFRAFCHSPNEIGTNKPPNSKLRFFSGDLFVFSYSMNRTSFMNRIVSCWYSQSGIGPLKQFDAAIKCVIWLWQRLHTRFVSGYHWNHCVCVCVAVAKCVFVCVSMYLTRGHIKMNLGRIHTNMHTQQQNNVNHWSQPMHIKYEVMYSTL